MYVQRYGPQPQSEQGIDDPLAFVDEVVAVTAVASVVDPAALDASVQNAKSGYCAQRADSVEDKDSVPESLLPPTHPRRRVVIRQTKVRCSRYLIFK